MLVTLIRWEKKTYGIERREPTPLVTVAYDLWKLNEPSKVLNTRVVIGLFYFFCVPLSSDHTGSEAFWGLYTLTMSLVKTNVLLVKSGGHRDSEKPIRRQNRNIKFRLFPIQPIRSWSLFQLDVGRFSNTLLYSGFFLYSFTFNLIQLTALGSSSDLSGNVGHQLLKMALTKLSIFMDTHRVSLSKLANHVKLQNVLRDMYSLVNHFLS